MRLLIAGTLAVMLFACGVDSPNDKAVDSIAIRLRAEPDVLHPIISQRPSSEALERLIYRCPQELNPQTLRLEPVLLSEPPIIDSVAGTLRYTLNFRTDAFWYDRTPITAVDHAFTLKAAMLPFVANNRLYTFLDIIDSLSCPDHYTLDIWMGGSSMQTEAILTSIPTYPKHYCDPNGILDDLSFTQLKDIKVEDSSSLATELRQFSEAFGSTKFTRDSILSAGPYRLDNWISNDQLKFTAIKNHWTTNAPDFVRATTNQITYRLLPDAILAMSGFRNGQLDVLPKLRPEQFEQLQTEIETANYKTHPSARYYFIALNNEDPILKDVLVRKALAHSMNVEACIDRLFYSFAKRIVGPINPSKTYYADHLSPIPYDLELASELLDSTGWVLDEPNGIRKKRIDGKLRALRLEITTSAEGLSKDVGLILQESCREIGIGIELKPQGIRQTMRQVRSQSYQMACLAASQTPDLDDPYNGWHSSQRNTGGRNYCVFGNTETDQAIENIRTNTNAEDRNRWYRKFQELIYREQPAIFLVTPMHLVAYQSHLDLETTFMDPGFFANSIK